MTFRPASVEALRRLGKTEQDIADRIKSASRLLPSAQVDKEVPLLPGKTDEDLVQAFMKGFHKIENLSPEEDAKLSREMHDAVAEINQRQWPMYGKHFASMYEGSMVGAGAVVFAVMGYIIAKAEPDRVVGTQVELNPKLLAMILGEEEKDVAKAIERLCSPDASSRTPDKEGRRLIKIGTFAYQVVNGAKYRAIRDDEERRRQNREAQQRYRNKKGGSKREKQFEKAHGDGDDARADGFSDAMHDKPVEHSPAGPVVDDPVI